jgi:hypothetical protein
MEKSIQLPNGGASLAPLSDIEKAAHYVAQSGMFGVKTQDQAVALMLVAQSEGMHYARAAMAYDVISGKPALKSSEMLSRFQGAGGKIEYKKSNDKICIVELSHPQGGSITIEWSMERAKKCGLDQKDTWKKYPEQMLRARAVSEGVRALFPACLNGFYTTEEIQDFPKEEKAQFDNNTPPTNPAPKAQDAEVVPEAPACKPQPDYTVNIGGTAPKPAAGLTDEEFAALGAWVKELPDIEKAKTIIKKYCPLNAIRTLSKKQAGQLVAELQNVFAVTYIPDFLEEEKEPF